jgi:hypothetical protein
MEGMGALGIESDAGLDVADAASSVEPAASMDEGQPSEPPAVPLDAGQPPGAPPTPPPGSADDSVRCGDGVLDDDELCDVSIEAGQPGACPTSCASDPCHPQRLVIQGCFSRCVAAASSC